MSITQFVKRDDLCDICKRRKAISLCDFPIGVCISSLSGVPQKETITCDKKLCEKCRIHNGRLDFCAKHADEMKENMKGDLK